MEIKKLSTSTIHSLKCSQVITSISAVVKELLENSIDASASQIIVRLESHGLKKIEVQDNGIVFVSDGLATLGFRGEAIYSISCISDLVISTRTCNDESGRSFSFDNHGNMKDSDPCHLEQGTIVRVNNLFKKLPVRLQYYKSSHKLESELKNIKLLCIQYGVIHPQIKMMIYHDKHLVWNKPSLSDIKLSLLNCLGSGTVNSLELHSLQTDKFKLNLYLPKGKSEVKLSSSYKPFIYINFRPVQMKAIQNVLIKVLSNSFDAHYTVSNCPFFMMELIVTPGEIDVNVNPGKTEVFLKFQNHILGELEKFVTVLYKKREDDPNIHTTSKHLTQDPIHDAEKSILDPQKVDDVNKIVTGESIQYTINSQDTAVTDLNFGQENECINQDHDSSQSIKLSTTVSDQSDQNVTKANDDSPMESHACHRGVGIEEELNLDMDFFNELRTPWILEKPIDKDDTCLSEPQSSLERWCKGKGEMEPVTILRTDQSAGVTKENAKISSLKRKMNSNASKKKVSKLAAIKGYTLVHDEPIAKPKSAFNYYCDEMRPKLALEHSNVNFTVISKLLAEGWNKLTSEEKVTYNVKERNDNERYRTAYKKAKLESNKNVSSDSLDKTVLPHDLDRLALPPTQVNDPRPVFHIPYRNEPINRKDSEEADSFKLIGQLSNGLWICCYRMTLYVLNHYRLEELYIYKCLMSKHHLSYEKLSVPIQLDHRVVNDYKEVLLNLKSQAGLEGQISYVIDERLEGNGIQIKIIQDYDGTRALMYGLCNSIPSYGVDDLEDILKIIQGNPEVGLADCRPNKVDMFLQAEAVRINRNTTHRKSREDINLYLGTLGPSILLHACLHDKAIALQLIDTQSLQ